MVRTFFSLACVYVAASQASAGDLSIKPKVVHSQIKIDSVVPTFITEEGEKLSDQFNRSESINGTGFGLDLEFKLLDRVRVGGEALYTKYDEDHKEATDVSLGAFGTFDLISQDGFSVYGKGGLSLHEFAVDDYQSARLLNYDVGLGLSFALSSEVDLGAEYKYSETFVEDEMKSHKKNRVALKDVFIRRNDAAVFVAFKF